MYKGGSEHNLLYTIEENPYFVRSGAVIPMAGPDIMSLQKQSPDLRLFVVPGLGESTTSVYEDDGSSQSYSVEYATTQIYKMTTQNQVTVKVAPRQGAFKGMLKNRRVSVVLDGFFAPLKVTVNGVEVPYSRFASYDNSPDSQIWGYNGTEFQTIIWLSETPADQSLEIICSYDSPARAEILNGKKGLIKRIMTLTPEAKLKFAALKIKDFQLPNEFMSIAQCGSCITEDPFNANKYLQAMDVNAMIDNLNSWERLSAEFKAKVIAQTSFSK
jgi:hypothetical protein